MMEILEQAKQLYGLDEYEIAPVSSHEGGRNQVFRCSQNGENQYVLRISELDDRTEADFLAETEFVRYLYQNGAPVANVCDSVNGKLVESCTLDERTLYISLFAYAKGIMIADNGYRYREGAPLDEYFYNTGKVLGKIHQLSKMYVPQHQRLHYFDHYNMEYLNGLIPDDYQELKDAIACRLEAFHTLPMDRENYGLVHFDFSDGNYHIDMESGAMTAFDFDNCINCWYMFDLANLWTHGEGWSRFIEDAQQRMAYMDHYFNTILDGYRSETDVPDDMLALLPLFIDMVLIENIVDEFECCKREGEAVDCEDIEDAARCLIENIPYAGLGED